MPTHSLFKNFLFICFASASAVAFSQPKSEFQSGFFDLSFSIEQEVQVQIDGFETVTSGALELHQFAETERNYVLKFKNPANLKEDASLIQSINSQSEGACLSVKGAKDLKLVLSKTPILTPKDIYIKKRLEGYMELKPTTLSDSEQSFVRVGMTCVLEGLPASTFHCFGSGYHKSPELKLWSSIRILTQPK
jgi:hypothetical protein